MDGMVKVFVVSYGHDDPRKCSALKMVRLGYAVRVRNIHSLPKSCLILNPLSRTVLTPLDKELVSRHGLAVIDVSWKEGLGELERLSSSERPQRVLPLLFAGNPTNYAVATKLSSLEAVAAALYITGFKDLSLRILSITKWGNTFYELNKELLTIYSQCTSVDELMKVQDEVLRRLKN